MEGIQFEIFEYLLKAPSKDFINKTFLEAFLNRDEPNIPESISKSVASTLEIEQNQAELLIKQCSLLIKKILFEGYNELSQIQNLFASSSIQANLKNLLSKLLLERTTQFRKSLIENENMMPKLVDFDWRVDIKMASNLSSTDSTAKSGQQTCILQLKNGDAVLSNNTLSNTKEENRLSRSQSMSKRPILDIYEIIKQQFRKRSEKQLGLLSFFARVYPSDKCGSNGLPLTPNSIRIYGKFQYLKSLRHRFLCRYVNIQRGNQERLFVISEHYSLNLADLLNDTYIYNLIMANMNIIIKWTYQMLQAFAHLSSHSIVHRYLHLRWFCITPESNLKLCNYGLFYMSECGYCVDFPIVNYATLAPECVVLEYLYGNKFDDLPTNNNEKNVELNNSKCDVWSLGVILFQFLFGLSSQTESSQQQLNELISPENMIENALNLLNQSENAPSNGYEYLIKLYKIEQSKRENVENRLKPVLLNLMKKCLTINLTERPSFHELIVYFEKCIEKEYKTILEENEDTLETLDSIKWKLFESQVRSDYLNLRYVNSEEDECEDDENRKPEDLLWKRGIDETYYLWRLAGGDCVQTLKQNGLLAKKLMPIQKMPIYTTVENAHEYGKPEDTETYFNDTIIPLSLEQLRNRLSGIKRDGYYPIIHENDRNGSNNQPWINNVGSVLIENNKNQPLNIKEQDIDYQFHRMILFSRYLAGYPFKKDELYRECRIDIPPIYRGLAWGALLDVKHNIKEEYEKINKDIITATDRQIDVDIPRCHQYDPLMASPQAHYRLKRILKAWVLSNSNLVYWQGLDSLSAPFLYLNFNNEPLAYGCLTNFINKYATNFFLRDNSHVIQEYLAVFSQLIAFHDAELAVHFDSIDFKPDLYAIPWFLTMFAHVFPLQKIFHLWDTLLLGSSSFPLCIGAAILKQLRSLLMNSDFNECILLFSELPEINIVKCVSDSIELFCWTPSSCLYRYHSSNVSQNDRTSVDDSELDLCSVEIEQMRIQLCPRISPRDVLKLCDSKSSKLILIDIRPSSEYQKCFIENSKNIPFENVQMNKLFQLYSNQINTANENDSTSYLIYLLQQNKSLLKILLGSRDQLDKCIQLANSLVKLKISKVCLIDKGIECFKSTKIYFEN